MSAPGTEGERRWARWLAARNRRGLRIGLLITITLYPAFGLLDVMLAPRPALPALLATRGVIAALTLALFRLLRTSWFDRHWQLVTAAFACLVAAGISMMTPYMGGLASPYYAGLTLTIVAAGLLFVWPPAVVVATHAGIAGSFLGANALAGTLGRGTAALSNLAFLSATALAAAVGQILAFRTQREQLLQRVQLEQATARLERAHAELKKLDQFKSRFSANMTHELRTPLAMVLAPLELMLQGEVGEFTEAQRGAFQAMFRSALKLLKIVNDLLDLSRLEESRLRLEAAEHDLVEQLRTLTEQSQVLARRKSIALALAPGPAAAPVVYDLERMERVFVNLLSNAIKFTPPGGHVTVAVRDLEGAVEVEVADDGPGFPPDQATRIFERFYQVDMAGTRQFGGAGIGLALARELVALHGGAIRAESDGRSGARFTVTLRKGRDHLRADALAPAAAGDAGLDWAVQLSSRREFRLLDIEEASERRVVDRDLDEGDRPYSAVVVEDSPQIVRLVHMALRRQFKVLAAPDGLKGLEMIRRERPSLVVTDLMMPGIDGLELTRRLREDPATRQIPVLMLTARGEVDDRVRGLETGVSAYLTKPFSPKELVTCARQLVQAEEETADLVLSQRMESLEIVAAGLAHEMNNPLNYARNALGRVRLDLEQALALARGGALGEEAQGRLEALAGRLGEMLGVAESGLRRIGGTVELMGRYGRGGFRREVVPLDAWEAVRTVVDVVLPATGRRAEVRCDLRGDGVVECVAEEFNQVLTNLVQNAIEAAPEAGGRVVVRGDGDPASLRLSVKDNGPGVSAEARARLFTPFFTTKGPGRGTGLGLTIARRVVQSLGGSLQLVSPPGEGAEFVVTVPRQRRAG
ncbi:ATP-binding protein [Anaeromyxobacter paludicola]|uniref:histidine kinase n=1 Tax=Anaeromyxobacter paludicola TaxID=2918171 RepID=A0ABM7XAD4_9BACT|nr:ATP-binding protein [Anaeromyxobacter paludicola]BDG08813.1 ATPase [Anaeromyxobacter paludicola]